MITLLPFSSQSPVLRNLVCEIGKHMHDNDNVFYV